MLELKVCPEFLRERLFVGPTGNRGHFEAHVPGVLHTPRCPNPPIPRTATRSPAFAGAFRRALNVVIPAQSNGAASTDERSSGIDTSPLAFAIITSAYPPS